MADVHHLSQLASSSRQGCSRILQTNVKKKQKNHKRRGFVRGDCPLSISNYFTLHTKRISHYVLRKVQCQFTAKPAGRGIQLAVPESGAQGARIHTLGNGSPPKVTAKMRWHMVQDVKNGTF